MLVPAGRSPEAVVVFRLRTNGGLAGNLSSWTRIPCGFLRGIHSVQRDGKAIYSLRMKFSDLSAASERLPTVRDVLLCKVARRFELRSLRHSSNRFLLDEH